MKPVACHTPSCRRSVTYAAGEDNPKVVARDYLNCAQADALGRAAWAQLDATRAAHGADRPRMRARKGPDGAPVLGPDGEPERYDSTIYYEHFILSPDPRDKATLGQVRAVATEWVAGEFPDFEAVIGYHRDTGIPHAHAIVNGVSVDGSRRVTDVTKSPTWCREAWGRLQDVARAHGLSGFEDTSQGQDARRHEAAPAAFDDRPERAMAARGAYSWLADLRCRADCAARLSEDVDGFRAALGALGVELVPAAKGDWKYRLADAPSRQATGRRLGDGWTEFGVGRRLARERSRGVRKPEGEAREALLGALSALVACGAQEVRVVGTAPRADDPAERLARLRRVARSLAWAQARGVGSRARLEELAREGGPEAREAAETLLAVGYEAPAAGEGPARGRQGAAPEAEEDGAIKGGSGARPSRAAGRAGTAKRRPGQGPGRGRSM